MECFVCKNSNASSSTQFISVLQLSFTDLEVLKRRLQNIITDENIYVNGNICKVHYDKYLKWYSLNQKICCDPFKKHPNSMRAKSLKRISLNLSNRNPNILIPGKKLCVSCYSTSSQTSTSEPIIPTVDIESNSDPDFNSSTMVIEQLNKSCEVLDLSPVKVDRYNTKRKCKYMQKKVSQIKKCVTSKAAAALGVDLVSIDEPQNKKCISCTDCISTLEKLLYKFSNASFKEKVQILTLVPDSWTINKTMEYFNTTEYLVKKSRKLKSKEGVLSMPSGRKGVILSLDTRKKVIDFYYDDNNSRICPGKKDCVSVPTENGRVLKQKRLILHNLKELYIAFKEEHKDVKIGLSKFCSLRPRECVTVSSKGIHSICVCIYHQNIKLMLHALHISEYMSLLKQLVCSIESEECMMHRCNNCPSPEILKEKLMQSEELEMINEVTYKQWVQTDGAELKTLITSFDEFIDDLLNKLSALCAHHFITKSQSQFFKHAKENLSVGTAIVVADFSENYTCIVQDAIQSFHWKKEQVTLHPFLAHIKDSNNKLKSISMCVISDELRHDTMTFWFFQKIIVEYLVKQIPLIKHIKYFSDGASGQYKNYKNFINLCHHEEDHGVKAEWHFFASCHGKGACDGIGGTIKRMASKASLQRPYNNILNAVDLYNFAKESIKGIEVFFAEKSEIDYYTSKLKDRYKKGNTISGTRSNHSFLPLNNNKLLVSRISGSSTTFVATIGFEDAIRTLTLQKEQYVACMYGINWWIGKILDICEKSNAYKVMFMHPHGPNPSYTWPKSLDVCWIPYEHIIRIVSCPVTTTGRTYHIAPEENRSIELLCAKLCL